MPGNGINKGMYPNHPDRPRRTKGLCMVCYERDRYRTDETFRQGRIEAGRGIRNRRKYGLTSLEVDALFESQGERCGICRKAVDAPSTGSHRERRRTTVIDHCHATGKTRGILCTKCNTALGQFGDDPENLQRAMLYLRTPPLPAHQAIRAMTTSRPFRATEGGFAFGL